MKNKFILSCIVINYIIICIFGFSKATPIIRGEEYGNIVSRGYTDEKVVALTFDDGPHPEFTNKILDLLKEYDVKSTFFVLGKLAEKYPEIIRRQWEEGHEIGNHTYSHINIKNSPKERIIEEYEKTQNIITSITNEAPKLFRPPYGAFNHNALDIMEAHDSVLVLWSEGQDSRDWSNPEVEKIVNTTLTNIKNGDIILFDDYVYYDESNTIEALKLILPALKSRGYRFVTVSELIDINSKSNNKIQH